MAIVTTGYAPTGGVAREQQKRCMTPGAGGGGEAVGDPFTGVQVRIGVTFREHIGITDALHSMDASLERDTGAEALYNADAARLVGRLPRRYLSLEHVRPCRPARGAWREGIAVGGPSMDHPHVAGGCPAGASCGGDVRFPPDACPATPMRHLRREYRGSGVSRSGRRVGSLVPRPERITDRRGRP